MNKITNSDKSKELIPEYFVFDVDGVFTNGQFTYTADGKFSKTFGAHDNDGIKLLRPYLSIAAITGDKRGYAITSKRIDDDMGINLTLVPEESRMAYMSREYDLSKCIYMGDGMFDVPILEASFYGIAPSNAFHTARNSADYVTDSAGGEGAVAEACWHVMEKFFMSVKSTTLVDDKKATA